MSDLALATAEFSFGDTTLSIYGTHDKPLFLTQEVCEILDIKNSVKKFSSLAPTEKHKVTKLDSNGRLQTYNAVNEAGLYKLILTSIKPEAEKFKNWVTGEVLPSIRKTGKYQVNADIQAIIDKANADAKAANEKLNAITAELEKKDQIVKKMETEKEKLQQKLNIQSLIKKAGIYIKATEEVGLYKIGKAANFKDRMQQYGCGNVDQKEFIKMVACLDEVFSERYLKFILQKFTRNHTEIIEMPLDCLKEIFDHVKTLDNYRMAIEDYFNQDVKHDSAGMLRHINNFKPNEEVIEVPDHQKKLEQLFSDYVNQVKKHVEETKKIPTNATPLGDWCIKQRCDYNHGNLTEERKLLMDSIPGWTWHYHDDNFNTNLDKVSDFLKAQKRQLIITDPEGEFINTLRKKKRNGFLSPQQETAIELTYIKNGMKMIWDVQEEQWQGMYIKLCEYADKYNALPTSTSDKQLYNWASDQRKEKRAVYPEGKSSPLTKLKIEQLEKIPHWSWEANEREAYMEKINEILDYKNKHGKLPPKKRGGATGDSFVINQRTAYNKKKENFPKWKLDLLEEFLPEWKTSGAKIPIVLTPIVVNQVNAVQVG